MLHDYRQELLAWQGPTGVEVNVEARFSKLVKKPGRQCRVFSCIADEDPRLRENTRKPSLENVSCNCRHWMAHRVHFIRCWRDVRTLTSQKHQHVRDCVARKC